MTRYLHTFPHGLGDCLGMTAVLRNVPGRHYVQVGKGKESVFRDVATTIPPLVDPYDRIIKHDWPECWSSWSDSPGTKAARCLREVFGVVPKWEDLKYSCPVRPETTEKVRAYLSGLERGKGFVAFHYEGNTSTSEKNLTHEQAREVCGFLIEHGYTVLLLDWDRRSPLPDGRKIVCPDVSCPLWEGRGTGDGETIAALIRECCLAITVDSGPGKIMYTTDTPGISVWVRYHPYHYSDWNRAVHVVPDNHEDYLRGDKRVGLAFFQEHYKYVTYPAHCGPVEAINNQAAKVLGLNPMPRTAKLRATSYDREYYSEHAEAGLDYLNYGDWQRQYGQWLVSAFELQRKHVLDVGCACGSIACGLAEAGALVSGCDCNEHMIRLGRERWLRDTLKICDATNLHYWRDGTFDLIHSAQVLEHLRPEIVPLVLRECARVTRPGGLLFAALDTEELYQRQGRYDRDEDPTHYCIRPMSYWHSQAEAAGWIVSDDLLTKVKDAPGSFFRSYDWDAFCCIRKSGK